MTTLVMDTILNNTVAIFDSDNKTMIPNMTSEMRTLTSTCTPAIPHARFSSNDSAAASHEATLIMFILWGVILPMVAGVGLIGNILTMVVLWRREMHSTTVLYLRALVITDTGILIGSVITLTPISLANYLKGSSLRYFQLYIYPNIYAPGYYIIMTLQECNVWITVAVTIERYIAICHPFRAARLITRRKTLLVIFTITVISLLYNLPHIFATRVVERYRTTENDGANLVFNTTPNAGDGGSLNGAEFYSSSTDPWLKRPRVTEGYRITETDFGSSKFYVWFRKIPYAAIIHVIPLLALLILNSFLIRELMVMKKRRSSIPHQDDNEANLSMVLVLIVVVFIICQTPGLVSQFEIKPKSTFEIWVAAANLLFTTNSAVNFLIYTAFGRKFRRVLLRVFRRIANRGSRLSSFSVRGWGNTDYEMSTAGENGGGTSGNGRLSEDSKLYENPDCKDVDDSCNTNGNRDKNYEWNRMTQQRSICENLLNGREKSQRV